MTYIVAITSQGQLTLPKALREELGITGQARAIVEVENGEITVRPQQDFWSLAGAGAKLSKKRATDSELKKARNNFAKKWPRPL